MQVWDTQARYKTSQRFLAVRTLAIDLCLVKTLRPRRMIDLQWRVRLVLAIRFSLMIPVLRYFIGWIVCIFRSREELLLENLALRQAIARPAHQTTAPPTHCMAQSVLGRLAKALVRLETTARPGYTEDGGSLAARRLSALLEMDRARQTNGRQEACEQACSGSDLSHGH